MKSDIVTLLFLLLAFSMAKWSDYKMHKEQDIIYWIGGYVKGNFIVFC